MTDQSTTPMGCAEVVRSVYPVFGSSSSSLNEEAWKDCIWSPRSPSVQEALLREGRGVAAVWCGADAVGCCVCARGRHAPGAKGGPRWLRLLLALAARLLHSTYRLVIAYLCDSFILPGRILVCFARKSQEDGDYDSSAPHCVCTAFNKRLINIC